MLTAGWPESRLHRVNPALLEQAIKSILTHAPLSNRPEEASRSAIEVAQALLGGRSKACAGWDHRTNRAFALPAQTALLSRAACLFDPPGAFIGQGGEHVARYEADSGLVFKTNLPEERRYGYVVDQGSDADNRRLMLREALPSEYLLRLGLQNTLFGDAIRLQAVALNTCHADYPLIVTSQPYAGGEMPSLEDIAGLMIEAGFVELEVSMLRAGAFRSPVWYHALHGVVATDATPGNFAKLATDVLAPVDLIIHPMPDELLRETARLTSTPWPY